MRIGVISDTHGLLRPEAASALRGVAHILHAGDIGSPGIVEALGALAPVTAIRGNVDASPWAADLPESRTLRLGGRSIHLLHDLAGRDAATVAPGAEVVVFGHSHRPSVERREGVLLLNPGSAGPRRFRLPVSLAILTLGEGAPAARIHHLLPP